MSVLSNPCIHGLTRRCFERNPEFAYRAFAFRLLSLFSPGEVSKLLQKYLALIFLPPGETLPVGIDLPPWSVVFPGVIWPPGWQWGDPLPPGSWLPPDFWNTYPSGGLLPPDYLSGFSGGYPGIRPSQLESSQRFNWFIDSFNSFSTSVWTDESLLTTLSIVSGRLKSRCVSPGGNFWITRQGAAPVPKNYELSFKFEIESGADYAEIDFFSGFTWLNIYIDINATSTEFVSAVNERIRIKHKTGDNVTYFAWVRNTTVDFYIDGISVVSGHDLGVDTDDPGAMDFWINDPHITYLDYWQIIQI